MSAPTPVLIPLSHFASWLAAGERGLSSEAIVATLTGQKVGLYSSGRDYPHDAGDFGRCERLLRAYPLARLHFHQMASVSPVWANFVAAWDEIAATFDAETLDGVSLRWSAPRTYALIQEVIAR